MRRQGVVAGRKQRHLVDSCLTGSLSEEHSVGKGLWQQGALERTHATHMGWEERAEIRSTAHLPLERGGGLGEGESEQRQVQGGLGLPR